MSPLFHCQLPSEQQGLRYRLFALRSLGVVGGFAVLSLLVFGLFFWRRRGLNIPRIRKATGPMSLFDPQERRPDLGMEEATVKRPLLYVRGNFALSFPFQCF